MLANRDEVSLPAQNPANLEKAKLNEYQYFDWLRLLLALLVVLDHSGALSFHHAGGYSVDVFFALSGWLIGSILLRTAFQDLPRFFFNRATRIWIPYVFAIIILYSVAAARDGISYYWLKYLFFDTTFTHNLFTVFPQATVEMPLSGSGNQFWSISVEEQFYLVSPLVIIFAPAGRSLPTWGIIVAIMVATKSNGAPVALGVMAALANKRWPNWFITIRSKAALLAIAAGSISGMFASLEPTRLFPAVFAIAAVLLLAVPRKRTKLSIWAGGISYPIYLNHWISLIAVNEVQQRLGEFSEVVKAILCVALSVASCAVLYALVDLQVAKHRDRWFSPHAGKTLAGAAYGIVMAGIIVGPFWT